MFVWFLCYLQEFDLEFHFTDNEYFTNKVLTKRYKLSCEITKDDPFSFEGATITKVTGLVSKTCLTCT